MNSVRMLATILAPQQIKLYSFTASLCQSFCRLSHARAGTRAHFVPSRDVWLYLFFFLPSFPAQPQKAEALDDKLKPDSIINDDDDDDHGGGNDENDVTLDTDDDGVMIWRREGRRRRDRCCAN